MEANEQDPKAKATKSKKQLTPSEKIAKAKQDLIKAQEKVKNLQEKRKLEIVNLLFKIDPKIIDYNDAILEEKFRKVLSNC